MIVFGSLFFILSLYYATSTEESEEIDVEYVLNFDSFPYVCGDDQSEAYFDTSQVEVTRYNESTTAMSGAIRFLKGLELNTLVELYVEKDFSGRYELVMSHEICDICDELGKEGSNYYYYLKSIGLPQSCPFESAEYMITDLVLDTKYLPVNSANAGRYLLTLNLFHSPGGDCTGLKTFIACLKVDVVIEPK